MQLKQTDRDSHRLAGERTVRKKEPLARIPLEKP
uniref:Uncharacterized protein n=1 Tax=Nelumbo nucifera TaxID=4432 RepID=A0A822XQX7_NELNU|nr:TPA_asm: hypothetical protein HUJ06_021341 [Nelumbo nucifera]